MLECSTSPGYLVGKARNYQDYFCPIAVYVSEDLPIHSIPQLSIHINAAAASKVYTRNSSDSITQPNRLLDSRLKNLVRVHNSDFDAPSLPSETRAIANALGACIIDAPNLPGR